MTETADGGAALAWRLLATLEGGSLLLATSALIAYTARSKLARSQRRNIQNVLVTHTTNTLGKELTRRLESRGCTVSTVTDEVGSGKVDALVVVGAGIKGDGLDGISELMTEDMYYNLKLLEKLVPLVRPGGCLVWACAGAISGPFNGASAAYDDVLRASLQHTAKRFHCEPVWVGRCEDVGLVAERVIASLFPCSPQQRFSIRLNFL